jgi:adenylate cyclase
MGVGLNSGPLMVGNVGSEQRLEYTAIGDTVNIASRLEGMTKGSDAMLYVAEATRERMQPAPEDFTLVGDVEVRGRSGALRVWSIRTPEVEGDEKAIGASSEGELSGASDAARA